MLSIVHIKYIIIATILMLTKLKKMGGITRKKKVENGEILNKDRQNFEYNLPRPTGQTIIATMVNYYRYPHC